VETFSFTLGACEAYWRESQPLVVEDILLSHIEEVVARGGGDGRVPKHPWRLYGYLILIWIFPKRLQSLPAGCTRWSGWKDTEQSVTLSTYTWLRLQERVIARTGLGANSHKGVVNFGATGAVSPEVGRGK
jgi:hypothetical protein